MSDLVLSEYQKKIIDTFKNTKDNLFIDALAGCVDCDTEYFNGMEWIRIADYKQGDKVLQYNIDTSEASLVYPIMYHKYPCNEMWHFQDDDRNIDQVLSDEHNIVIHDGKKIKVKDWLNNRMSIFLPSYFYYSDSQKFKGTKLQHYIDKDILLTPYKTKDGYKYCFTMPLGTLILRRNDKIFITGNSGKTFILVELSKLINTYSVFLAFNKSIQEELKVRITNPKFKTYTFNGLGYMIMSKNWEQQEESKVLQNPNYKKKTLTLDTYKISNIMSNYFKKQKLQDELDEELYFNILSDTIHLYDLCRQRLVDLNDEDEIMDTIEFYDLYSDYIPENLSSILNYVMQEDIRQFSEDGVIDFIDQIFITYFMVKQGVWTLEYYHRFENILVDESQDLSRLQQLFIGLLRRNKQSRYIFVGDEFQSIYSFAGADCHSVNNIKRLYKTKSLELPINYRCPKKHLEFVNDKYDIPIQPAPNAKRGNLIRIEYDEICDYIENDDCILSRKNRDLCKIVLDLLDNDFAVYVRDESLVNKLIKKISSFKQSVNDLTDLSKVLKDIRQEYRNKIAEQNETLLDEEKETQLVDIVRYSDSNMDLIECVEVLLNRYIEDNQDNSTRLKSFDAFINYVKQRLCTKKQKGAIQCVSIHQAKGKEYNRVFILNNNRICSELAHTPDQLQQEENLAYIAMTRSKDTIFLVSPDEREEENESENEDDEDIFSLIFY